MHDILMNALYGLAAAAVVYVTAVVSKATWAKRAALEVETEKSKADLALLWALNYAKAAAQSIPDTSARYDWVAAQLLAKLPWLEGIDVKGLIEAAVHSIKEEAAARALGVAGVQAKVDSSVAEAVAKLRADLAAGKVIEISLPPTPKALG